MRLHASRAVVCCRGHQVVRFLSVWAVSDAPPRVESLLPLNRAYQSTRYGKLGMILALANVVWSIVAVIYLGWWS